MARVRLPLQIALAMVAALLSLYLWLRAIGGDPGVAPLRSPAPLATDRIVARFDTPRRLRAHVGRLHEQRSAAAGSRLALSPAAAVRPVAAGASSAGRSGGGGGSPAPAAPGSSSSPPPPTASPSTPPPSPPPPPPSPPAKPPAPGTPSAPKPSSPPPPSPPAPSPPAPKPPPPPPGPPPTPSDTSTKPGWGCGDENHTHSGPPGKGGDKGSPC